MIKLIKVYLLNKEIVKALADRDIAIAKLNESVRLCKMGESLPIIAKVRKQSVHVVNVRISSLRRQRTLLRA